MKCNVKRIYKVEIIPYNDDEDSLIFSLSPLKTGLHTVQFDTSYGSDEHNQPKYIGYHDGKFWYIDSNYSRGLFLNTPLNVSETADDLSEIEEYDEDECIINATSVEILVRDFFNYTDDLPF